MKNEHKKKLIEAKSCSNAVNLKMSKWKKIGNLIHNNTKILYNNKIFIFFSLLNAMFQNINLSLAISLNIITTSV